MSGACARTSDAEPAPTPSPTPAITPRVASAAPPIAAESSLGVVDRGIFSDLDAQVQLSLPAGVTPARVTATIDSKRALLVVYVDGFPRKVYPLEGAANLDGRGLPAAGSAAEGQRGGLDVGRFHLALRPGDRAELAPLLTEAHLEARAATPDRDGDGIPDSLDVLIGAYKTVLNADAYTEGYFDLKYPGGDMPRDKGVCTDVIIRAARNAGIDIQVELHEDIARAKRAYPMVKGPGDPSIDQRRVGTLVPYFLRHWEKHSPALDDPSDPLRPGDIILMDTFPDRPGPDHIGIISDQISDNGFPYVINNWTDGYVTKQMPLLPSVPVLYRFRAP